MLFQQEETEMKNNRQMLQQMAYLNSKGEKNNVINSTVMTYARELHTYGVSKIKYGRNGFHFHLQTIQRQTLPEPKEKRGSKQRMSVFGSNKNCLKPSGG